MSQSWQFSLQADSVKVPVIQSVSRPMEMPLPPNWFLMIDANNRPIRGLPPQVVSAGICDAEAVAYSTFLAHGSLTEPGRSSALEITCPGPEAALALVGSATATSALPLQLREVREVLIALLSEMEMRSVPFSLAYAHESVLAWEERRMRREVRATANRLAIRCRLFTFCSSRSCRFSSSCTCNGDSGRGNS
jgi:hypothetical protein